MCISIGLCQIKKECPNLETIPWRLYKNDIIGLNNKSHFVFSSSSSLHFHLCHLVCVCVCVCVRKIIRYFIPEDGDEEDYPNIFLMPKQQGHTGFSPKLRGGQGCFSNAWKLSFSI